MRKKTNGKVLGLRPRPHRGATGPPGPPLPVELVRANDARTSSAALAEEEMT